MFFALRICYNFQFRTILKCILIIIMHWYCHSFHWETPRDRSIRTSSTTHRLHPDVESLALFASRLGTSIEAAGFRCIFVHIGREYDRYVEAGLQYERAAIRERDKIVASLDAARIQIQRSDGSRRARCASCSAAREIPSRVERVIDSSMDGRVMDCDEARRVASIGV